MKMLQTIMLSVLVCCCSNGVLQAQGIKDPTTWTYEVKKTGSNSYELVIHARMDSKWHLYSMNPGGDGTMLPPVFKFKAPANVKLVGKVKEMGKMTTEEIPGIDGAVHYYRGSVDYVQQVTVTGSAKITGEHEYQVCSDELCLPPKTKAFVFEIKP